MARRSRGARTRASLVVVAALLVTSCAPDRAERTGPANEEREGATAEGDAATVERLPGVTTASRYDSGFGLAGWQEALPAVEDVRITSTADGTEQPALWLPPSAPGPQPLLVVLHSWSFGYLQHYGIPFGELAAQQGWAMIAPDFRGPFVGPEATGSALAVQDVVDAVDFAAARADIDERHVYTVGFSGGGMMGLLLAGRHPDRFAGVVSWVPVYDLGDWHDYLRQELADQVYDQQIRASCGGAPEPGTPAGEECAARSPRTYLEAAREASVPVYLGHGLSDNIVPPDHAARAFNRLADPGDRFSAGEVDAIAAWRVPDRIDQPVDAEHHFGEGDPDVVLARRSGPVTLVLFDGLHDMVFHPGVAWIAARVTEADGDPAANEPS